MVCLLVPAGILAADEIPAVRTYTAAYIDKAPVIDGFLEPEIWQAIPAADSFIQRRPDPGKPATEPTEARLVYDDQAIYVAFTCYDSEPDKIIHRICKRDSDGNSDFVEVDIDSYHDHRTGYTFVVNAAGIQEDDYRYKDGEADLDWNAVWQAEARLTDFGWTAEFKIPFSCLRFNKSDQEQTWGINFVRIIRRKNETALWAPILPEQQGFISKLGHLAGIKVHDGGGRLEILPYAVSSARMEPRRPGNPDGRAYTANSGLDLKYSFTRRFNMTIDAAINPDFGQVEVDPAVLNLTTYETFFPEKRPFFIEGNKYFDTDFDLFYSRRIGRAPRDYPQDAAYIFDYPKTTTILAAVKAVGKSPEGWIFGAINAVTAEEKIRYVDNSGIAKTAVVENPANYNVIRLKREFDGGSSIGIMSTGVNQRRAVPVYTGGVDWTYSFKNRAYSWGFQAVGSKNETGGWGFNTGFMKNSGKHFRWSVGVEKESENLDLNRLGYIRRSDYQGGWGWLQYRIIADSRIIKELYNNFNYWTGFNGDGDRLNFGGNYNFWMLWANNWGSGGGIEMNGQRFDDRETRGGPLYMIPRDWSFWGSVDSDYSKKLAYSTWFSNGRYRHGRYFSSGNSLTFKPDDNISVTTGPSYERTWDQYRWVDTQSDSTGQSYIFARLKTEMIDLNLRTLITFNKKANVEVYSQILLAAGAYNDFVRLVNPAAFEQLPAPYQGNPDFRTHSFIVNAVFTWEYSPGSTIYIVFTQGRSLYENLSGMLAPTRDIRRLFELDAESIFLVKLNYWLGY